MPPPSVEYASAGGAMQIEVHIGNVVAASFELDLWKGAAKTALDSGVNDVATKVFSLDPPMAQYNGQVVSWDVVVSEMISGDDQYLVTISIRQDGNLLFTHPWSGKFGTDQTLEIFGGVSLVAK